MQTIIMPLVENVVGSVGYAFFYIGIIGTIGFIPLLVIGSISILKNKRNYDNTGKMLFFIIADLFIGLYFLYTLGLFDGVILSRYDNKIYTINSADGKISGTITTTVSSCSETNLCVNAYYDITLNDAIPSNTVSSDIEKNYYFDPNYYYVANIYNNKLSPHEYSYDASLKPIDATLPSNEFSISFKEILRGRSCAIDESNEYYCYGNSSSDFLKLNHLDVYDASNPAYINKETGFVDEFAPLKETDKIKSYDFTVSPQ